MTKEHHYNQLAQTIIDISYEKGQLHLKIQELELRLESVMRERDFYKDECELYLGKEINLNELQQEWRGNGKLELIKGGRQ